MKQSTQMVNSLCVFFQCCCSLRIHCCKLSSLARFRWLRTWYCSKFSLFSFLILCNRLWVDVYTHCPHTCIVWLVSFTLSLMKKKKKLLHKMKRNEILLLPLVECVCFSFCFFLSRIAFVIIMYVCWCRSLKSVTTSIPTNIVLLLMFILTLSLHHHHRHTFVVSACCCCFFSIFKLTVLCWKHTQFNSFMILLQYL